MSSGMMTTMSTTLMPKEGHFLVVDMTTTQRFDFAVEQTEVKVTLFYFPHKLHFSCWHTVQRSVKWSSGQWQVWSGYFLIRKLTATQIRQEGRILLRLGLSTLQFTTATTAVGKPKIVQVLDIARHACLSPGALCKYSYFPS